MVLKKIGQIICWVITACGALLISAGNPYVIHGIAGVAEIRSVALL